MHLMNKNVKIDQISYDNCFAESDISDKYKRKIISVSDMQIAIISKMLKRIYTPLHRSHTKWINSTVIKISTFFRILILWHIIGICLCAGNFFSFYFTYKHCVNNRIL